MLLLGYHVIRLVFSSEKYQFDENTSGVDVVFYYKTHKIIDFFQEARGRGAKPLRSLLIGSGYFCTLSDFLNSKFTILAV